MKQRSVYQMFKIKESEKVMTGDAITLCRVLYNNLSNVSVYPALTGGSLYKDGERKDIDIVLYRNRQERNVFETEFVEDNLKQCGLSGFKYFGFVTKCKWGDIDVDIFNPETIIDMECDGYSND